MDLQIIEKTLYLDIGNLPSLINLEELLAGSASDDDEKDEEPVGEKLEEEEAYKLLRDVDYKNDYDSYEKIMCHIGFSEDLYVLNEKGQHIINQLKKKADPVTHELVDSLVETTYNSIRQTIRARNLGTGTFFNELMCVLDELMFSDVEDMDSFYLDDNEHKLTKIYYGQEEWTKPYSMQHFEFSKKTDFEEGEIMILMCYINDYLALLDRVNDYIEEMPKQNTTCIKVSKTISKIFSRLEKIKDQLTMMLSNALMIENTFKEKIE